MNHFKSFIFLALLFACSMYTYWLSNRDFEWIVPYMNDRAPAAVRESKDFQEVLEKPMRVFKREAVLSSISIDWHKGQQRLSMGQFPVATSKGPNLICLEYPYMKLTFAAEGAAISGKKTKFMVKAPCQIHPKNRDMMSDVPVPLEEIYRRPAQAQGFSVNGEMNIDVDVENVLSDWPKLWELESIEFFKAPNGEEEKIIFSKKDILEKTGAPIFVK